MVSLATLQIWRAKPSAVLILAFVQSLAQGFIELPVIYLFREIECEAYAVTLPPHLPEEDICRSPPVQKAYAADVAVYLAIATVLSIIVSGPYGRLSDMRGRKITMGTAASLNALGDTWLFLSALLPFLRSPVSLMFSALVKGLGGGFSVINAAQAAFVADTTPTATRSFYLGLSLVMYWIASAIAPLGCSLLLLEDRYAACFAVAVGCWALYLFYLVFVLKETRIPGAQRSHHSAIPGPDSEHAHDVHNHTTKSSSSVIFHSLVEPLTVVFGDPTLRWLGIASFVMLLAVGAFAVLIIYCDHMFGLHASEAGIIGSIMSISRAASVLCVLPVFIHLYRRFFVTEATSSDSRESSSSPANGASEQTPLLHDDTEVSDSGILAADPTSKNTETTVSARQELLICRICFLIDAIGMILISLSRNPGQITLSTALGSLGAPAGPSLQALVTLAAAPSEFGRVLAGFAIIESAGIALRNPLLFTLYGATLESMPALVWWIAAALFVFCHIIVMCLRPSRFTGRTASHFESDEDDDSSQ